VTDDISVVIAVTVDGARGVDRRTQIADERPGGEPIIATTVTPTGIGSRSHHHAQ
jgi:hypothetical protein